MFDAMIQRRGKPLILLVDDVNPRIGQSVEILTGCIGGAVIDDHKPPSLKGLTKDRIHGRRQVRHAVVDRHQNGNGGRIMHQSASTCLGSRLNLGSLLRRNVE